MYIIYSPYKGYICSILAKAKIVGPSINYGLYVFFIGRSLFLYTCRCVKHQLRQSAPRVGTEA